MDLLGEFARLRVYLEGVKGGSSTIFGQSSFETRLTCFSTPKSRQPSLALSSLILDLQSLDPLLLLHPFLLVIRSGDTSGPITGAALSSVERFVVRRLFPAHPNLPRAVSQLISAVTHCKFEATDAVSDEVVLGRILKLLRTVVGDAKEEGLRAWVDDRGMCEMVEASLGMCFQGRVSGGFF